MERISLGNEEFEGHNNAYVLTEGDQVTLIDAGIATPETRTDLRRGLDAIGLTFEDVDQVLLTHWHPDHTGLAGEIQQASGATVYAHEVDAPLASGDPAAMEAYEQLQLDCFERWGIPPEPLSELLAFFKMSEGAEGEPIDVTPLQDGDRIEIAGDTLTVRHAPGHTDGSAIFESSDEHIAFVGDVVLPVYTPNVGGADVRVNRPLATYLDTLTGIVQADYDRLHPGHRDPIDAPTARAETIIEHHHERTQRVVDVLKDIGPADPWSVSAELFGSLENIHIMHGPGEAFAHLDHLVHEGVVTKTDGNYAIAADETVIEQTIAATFD